MIKGCSKRAVVVSGGAESIFETAYFILKPVAEGAEESDILREANRLIEDKTLPAKGRKFRKEGKKAHRSPVLPFAAGAAVGSAAGLLWLFL